MLHYVLRSLAHTFSVAFINYVRQLCRYRDTRFFFLSSQLVSLSVSPNRFLKCPFRYNVVTTKTTSPLIPIFQATSSRNSRVRSRFSARYRRVASASSARSLLENCVSRERKVYRATTATQRRRRRCVRIEIICNLYT